MNGRSTYMTALSLSPGNLGLTHTNTECNSIRDTAPTTAARVPSLKEWHRSNVQYRARIQFSEGLQEHNLTLKPVHDRTISVLKEWTLDV